ncbi:MAG: hypothetical protein CL676_10605 [Bdellovibrionaceae bacterium]|nr:hypothetical protein [Pseudobdellovibrionaceae bacterium]
MRSLALDQYKELFEVPSRTISFWNHVKENGGKYLWFPFVTHVFVKGRIDTSGFEICEFKVD